MSLLNKSCLRRLLILSLVLWVTPTFSHGSSLSLKRESPISIFKQEITISGVVRDKANQLLPGVSIRVIGTAISSATDINGKYQIKVPSGSSVLVFSYVGFYPLEEVAGSRRVIDVILRENIQSLNEVVVIGYGTVNRKDLTGSVGKVDIEDMNRAPVASFEDALAGRVAGVSVSSNEGQPGAGVDIVIRGANSVTQSNSPLYVIDGFPIEDPTNAAINPADIASIDVLKDASAAAIYGSRAANGVIVIETKKGKVGKPVLTYDASLGFQHIVKTMDLMNPYEFVKLQQELDPVLSSAQYLSDRDLDSYRAEAGYDWQSEMFRTAPVQIHNLSLSGGSDQTRYALSGSIYDQDGIIINSGYKRYQGRISLDQTISSKLKAGIVANYSVVKNNGRIASEMGSSGSASSYLLYSIWGYRPVAGNNADLLGNLVDPEIESTNDFRVNPVISTNNEQLHSKNNSLTANAYFTYSILKDLTLKVTGGINSRMLREDAFYNSQTSRGTPLIPTNTRGVFGTIANEEVNTWMNENTLSYKKKFGQHTLDAVGGFTLQGRSSNNYGFTSQLVPNESLGLSGLDEGVPYSTVAAETENTLASFLGRINYNYKSKYLLTASFRADGSSKFVDDNKWGYFPSAAFAWRMSSENFMKKLTAVSDAKLRVSYGLTGNNRIPDFAALSALSFSPVNPLITLTNNYSFNNQTPGKGVIPATLENRDLKWETTTQLDLGYDLGLFKNRISVSADWYKKETKDLLLNANMPYSTGYVKALKNIGSMQNSGVELSLNTVNIQNKNFSWSSNFNISFNKNKVLGLSGEESTLFSTINWEVAYEKTPLYVAEVGHPVAQFYGYQWDGIYQYEDFDVANGVYTLKPGITNNGGTVQPGDIKYKDLNGDLKVNADDRTVIGNPMPKHTGGFTNNFRYKGIDLNVFFQWSYGNDILNANRIIFEGNALNYKNLNQYASYNNRWMPDNPSNTLARVGGQGPRGVYSSREIEDGSYLRLKTVSLGYNVPAKFLSTLKVNSVYISASAQNLFTWTNYSGIDPEVSVRNSALTPGFDYSAYPRAKTVTFNLKISL
ncbi:TonB-linked SusC/RagA family outer membrane protein [Arcticibacter tournemirensis]|uniref:TonB-dependent receptor n=1 Tax=Arcticibacter tournemirensis TaxID=699437 RepID=A0A5M9H7J5_9SPHI|nr:TonB-dependent receptor [Arcticibacter tournemirensis]KAA8482856.1 TonB-dependent receptor [Arcticibacter tournemirensis]TQM49767.1 TonB-linked SusC/RagA family outer membrane protein [Arcticibacter tournemirensis]